MGEIIVPPPMPASKREFSICKPQCRAAADAEPTGSALGRVLPERASPARTRRAGGPGGYVLTAGTGCSTLPGKSQRSRLAAGKTACMRALVARPSKSRRPRASPSWGGSARAAEPSSPRRDRDEEAMRRFVAEGSFWELFPDASIGVIVASGMKPAGAVPPEDAAAIARLLAEANRCADRHLTSNVVSENEAVRVWREAFRAFKTKRGARCSIENLLKRVLKGNPVGSIAAAVDICNAVSLKYALPVGGEDVDALVGDFRLGITEGGDPFLPPRRGRGRSHAARRALLPRRRGRRLPLLQLTRRPAHRAHRRVGAGDSGRGVRRRCAEGRAGGGARRALAAHRALSGSVHRSPRRDRPQASRARHRTLASTQSL